MTTLPDSPDAAMAALIELTERERSARQTADDLLEARDQLITEAIRRKDISKVQLEQALGLRRQWLYQIAARDQRLAATAGA